MLAFLTLTHFFIGTALTSLLGGDWWLCLLSGLATSASDVAAFFQVGLDAMRRRAMFSRQSKAMLVAKEISHTVFLWIISMLVLILKYPNEYSHLVPLWLSFSVIFLPSLHYFGGKSKMGLNGQEQVFFSWAALVSAVLLGGQMILCLVDHPYTLGPTVIITLGLLIHWIIDFLTHNWEKSEAKEGLDIPKEEADVSMFYPLKFWGSLGLPYDYRPRSNDLFWKFIPKGTLELAILFAAAMITAIKLKLL